ncbi:MAG: hypothetical protein INR71_14700 [Terriglobus roseus]|nr:hypothetical protein [Terriglobus roseus]
MEGNVLAYFSNAGSVLSAAKAVSMAHHWERIRRTEVTVSRHDGGGGASRTRWIMEDFFKDSPDVEQSQLIAEDVLHAAQYAKLRHDEVRLE